VHVAARLFCPIHIAGKDLIEDEQGFNERKFIVVYLKHLYDCSRRRRRSKKLPLEQQKLNLIIENLCFKLCDSNA